MSLQAKIMELIRDLKDPTMRIDVASSISFLSEVFRLNRATEEDIYMDLVEICRSVYKQTMPDKEESEINNLAEAKAKEILGVMRIYAATSRISRKYGLTF